MVLQARQRLSADHHAVNEVLKQLLTALDSDDLQTIYSRLDLLWARLAVHIRAEHLHLFPAIASRLAEAQPAIDSLRADHDFFMRELARALAIFRELPPQALTAKNNAKLASVAGIIGEVAKRLATHNTVEEDRVYRWASEMLSEPEQLKLLAHINTELENRPPRFSDEAWAYRLAPEDEHRYVRDEH